MREPYKHIFASEKNADCIRTVQAATLHVCNSTAERLAKASAIVAETGEPVSVEEEDGTFSVYELPDNVVPLRRRDGKPLGAPINYDELYRVAMARFAKVPE